MNMFFMRHALQHLEPQCGVNTCVKCMRKSLCEGVLLTLPVGYSGSPSTVNETKCNKKREIRAKKL